MQSFFERYSIFIALITAWAAMLGSLYFSEIARFVPCTLCWYQRILMYPLALLLLIGILRRDKQIAYYVLSLSLLGTAFSTYHYLQQKTDLFSHATVCSTGIPCTTTWINWLGFITIPFLALIAFIIISFMMLIIITTPPEDELTWHEVEAD